MISWAQLGLGVACIAGLGLAGFGALLYVAAGMSDAPRVGTGRMSRLGCLAGLAGLSMFAGSVLLLVQS